MLGELFERVANIDVELRCLGTKAFVAKEQFVNDVFYSQPKKSSKSAEEEKKEETKAEVSDLMDQIQKDKAEGKDTTELEKELKEKMNEFLVPSEKKEEPVTKEDINDLMSKIENGKANGNDTSELEKELKDKMEKFLSTPKAELAKCEPVINEPAKKCEPVTPEVTLEPEKEVLGMDFSAQVQPGVSYESPSQNPYLDAQAQKAAPAQQKSTGKEKVEKVK